jgi:Calcineurin-like phosphoesterase
MSAPKRRLPVRSRPACVSRRHTRAPAIVRMAALALQSVTGLVLLGALSTPPALALPLGEASEALHRRTSGVTAATGTPFRFAVLGDFGSGLPAQREVARRMCRRRSNRPFDMVVTTGDNVYPSGERKDFRAKFFRPYRCLRRNGVRFRASLGNHDYAAQGGLPELREPRFGMPARNYVVRSHGVRFVVANSNDLRRSWLWRATRARAGDRWTVVVFHHPLYSPGTGHGSSMDLRKSLVRLFEHRGVDLVLNGHDHIYSVTKPLDRIRYVVTGGGGASLYGCSSRWFLGRCRERHHFLVVAVRKKNLWGTAVPARGPSFHTWRAPGRD